MRVKEAMNKAVAIEKDISLKEAAKIMSDRNIGCLIILKNDKITGIITERDIMKNVSNIDRKISSAMSKNVITINHDESIDNAALIMAKNKIKKLPVVEKENLIGIITATDIVANYDILNEDFLLD